MRIDEAFSLLGLKNPSNREEIRKAFRRKIFDNHPDRFQDVHEQAAATGNFLHLKKAYDLLNDLSDEELENPGLINHQPRQEWIPRSKPINLPKWTLFKEIENLFALFYLLRSAKFMANRSFRLQFSFNLSNKNQNSRYQIINSFYRLRNLAIFGFTTAFFATFFVTGFVVVSTLLISLLGAAPFYFIFRLITQRIPDFIQNNSLASTSLAYLLLRSAALAIINLLVAFVANILLGASHSFYLYVLVTGVLFWIFLLHISILYEWVMFFRIKRSRIKG